MLIQKRDGSKEEFNPEKIENAILKAYNACGYAPTLSNKKEIQQFCRKLEAVQEGETTVEAVQDQVEKWLCKRCFPESSINKLE